jgi:hypothetical protein
LKLSNGYTRATSTAKVLTTIVGGTFKGWPKVVNVGSRRSLLIGLGNPLTAG